MDARSIELARLQDCPRLGPAGVDAVLRHLSDGVSASLYGQSTDWYKRELGVNQAVANALSSYSPNDTSHYSGLPIRMVTSLDGGYPPDLYRMERPPTLISEHGCPCNWLPYGSFTVLSSARWEMERSAEVKAAIQVGLEAGLRIISGHNRPIYQWSLLAAKRNAARSVMVLDRGFLCAFDSDMRRDPVAAARIWGFGFDAENCTAISAFRLKDAWAPPNGRRRDAMVCALADTIIVLGMRPGGTIHRLCAHALKHGQRVLVDADALELLVDDGADLWSGSLMAQSRAGTQSTHNTAKTTDHDTEI